MEKLNLKGECPSVVPMERTLGQGMTSVAQGKWQVLPLLQVPQPNIKGSERHIFLEKQEL